MTIKEHKLIWHTDFSGFTAELRQAFADGWTLVPRSLVVAIIPPDAHYSGTREKYLAVVEK
jgi:hypothetical protein